MYTTTFRMLGVLAVLFTATLIAPVDANMFLGRLDKALASDTLSANATAALFAEMELEIENKVFTERRLIKILKAMRPLYRSVPKNANGLVGLSAASYLLHRLFVLRHGWFVRGLHAAGKGQRGFNSLGASESLRLVSSGAVAALERRTNGEGISLHDLAIVAATLEQLMHKESIERLQSVYNAASIKVEDVVIESEVDELLKIYMAVSILGFVLTGQSSNITAEGIKTLRAQIEFVYPNWNETVKFVHDVKESVLPKRDYFYFADVSRVIDEVAERYGRWQDQECRAIKNELMTLEDTSPGGAGRIRLGDFYKKAIQEGKYQYGESREYLRQLGALDESDPSNPRILLANYVNSPSNCVSSSQYYSVCCINECEELFSQLEKELASPDAYPKQIATLVAALPSRTVSGGRTLPAWHRNRLDEIALHHGGKVPLHGRLFLQWMHYAYPRECPYPHSSGAIDPVGIEQVVTNVTASEAATESEFIADEGEMLHHISLPIPNVTGKEDAMWTPDEELIAFNSQQGRAVLSAFDGSGFSPLALMGLGISANIVMLRSLWTTLSGTCQDDKYYV